jgi:hypothetical protein
MHIRESLSYGYRGAQITLPLPIPLSFPGRSVPTANSPIRSCRPTRATGRLAWVFPTCRAPLWSSARATGSITTMTSPTPASMWRATWPGASQILRAVELRVWPPSTSPTRWAPPVALASSPRLRRPTPTRTSSLTGLHTPRSFCSTFKSRWARSGCSRPDIWATSAGTSTGSAMPTIQFPLACLAPQQRLQPHQLLHLLEIDGRHQRDPHPDIGALPAE